MRTLAYSRRDVATYERANEGEEKRNPKFASRIYADSSFNRAE